MAIQILLEDQTGYRFTIVVAQRSDSFGIGSDGSVWMRRSPATWDKTSAVIERADLDRGAAAKEVIDPNCRCEHARTDHWEFDPHTDQLKCANCTCQNYHAKA